MNVGLDFDGTIESPTSVKGAMPAIAILGFLSANGGLHAKSEILSGTGINDGQWNSGIAELIASGRVERQGEKRGARYRAKQFGGTT